MSPSLTRRLIVSAQAALISLLFFNFQPAHAKKVRAPAGGRVAVVVDERLAVLRDTPNLTANLLQRMSRGRAVSVKNSKVSADGLTFHRVAVTSRTSGWVQADALVVPARTGEDERLLSLIQGSEGFDRIDRAALFLELFPRSPQRPTVLALLGEAAEEAARRLSREAIGRLDEREMKAGGAPLYSYFLNYSGLDRYRRQGVVFTFNTEKRQYAYDGAAWREIVRRHAQSAEAQRARVRLAEARER